MEIEIKPKDQTKRHYPANKFMWAYLTALTLIALIFILSYVFAMNMLQQEATYSTMLKATNQFNLLSQNIAKTSLQIRLCTEQKNCEDQVSLLEYLVARWKQAFKELEKNNLLENPTSQTIQLVEKSRDYYYPMLKAAEKIISYRQRIYSFRETKTILRSSQVILINEKYLSQTLNCITETYYEEASANIARLKNWELGLLIFAILLLVLEAIFIFQPVVYQANLYFEYFKKANQAIAFEHEQLSEIYYQLKEKEAQTRRDAEIIAQNNQDLLSAQEELIAAQEELSKKNEHLQKALSELQNSKRLTESRFLDISLAEANKIMRWQNNETLESWCNRLLEYITPYVNGFQALIYILEEKTTLSVVGRYAVSQEMLLERGEIEIGETHVGQVAKSCKMIYFQNIEMLNYAVPNSNNGQNKNSQHILQNGIVIPWKTTQTATLEIMPTTLLVLPLMYYDNLVGVLEINALEPFSERNLELLKRLTEPIAANLHALNDQRHINQLFADSQIAGKKLRKTILRLQENEERFRKMVELTQEGLVFLQGYTIIDVNPALVKMMKYINAIELIGLNYIELIAPQYRFELEDRKIITTETELETVGLRKDGSTFPIELQVRKVTYKNEVITVISIHDITLRKQTEEELAEANRIASLVKVIEKKNKDITSSIEYAQRIQEAILPNTALLGKGFLEHFVFYKPKDIVSGDFYWYAEKNEHALIAAVDCTGHGVPGAFMSLIGYSQLNKIVIEQGIVEPHIVLSKLDEGVAEALNQKDNNSRTRDGMDIALCSLNIYEKKLSFAGAYRPMYLIREGEFIEFRADPFPIGGNFKYKKEKNFTPHTIYLLPRDTIYIFTDGFPDQFGGTENRKYMTKNFKNLLMRIQDYNMNEQKMLLEQEFVAWKGDYKQMDDILVIGLRF
ncbi:MAG: PAS domain S-box protein [Microscillaceae bacterium]|nr:PAS domain S-box protein [Microscillaceae bacterium]MDW8460543.1 PAS domain S-box protein [Cytophagales bacterium]